MPKGNKKAKNCTKKASSQSVSHLPQSHTSAVKEKKETKHPTIREAAAVEKLAISRTPQSNPIFARLQKDFFNARSGKINLVNAQGASPRLFIAAEVIDRTQTVERINYRETSHKDFINETGWVTIGKTKRFGPSIHLQDGERKTEVKFNPSRKQTGNYHIPV